MGGRWFISIDTQLSAGYGESKKLPLIKGSENNDSRTEIKREDIEFLGKVQDEYEKENNQEYNFQILLIWR